MLKFYVFYPVFMRLIEKIIYQMLKMLNFYVVYRNKAFLYIKIIYLIIINY